MPPPPGSLEPGAVVDGRYRLGSRIGQGGAASVFHAEDPELDRDVAIKFLLGGGHLADPARFQEEAQILASLQHPHIVTMYGFGVHGPHPYLVLELVDGGSLAGRLFAEALALEQAQEVARAVAAALAAAHEHGILHRDVKPGNVLLAADGTPKLADFGLAKSATSQVRTATGMIMGTPEFMAPEIFLGSVPGPAADVYAWACLAYYCVNRRTVAEGDVRAQARAHAAGAYRPGAETGPLAAAMRAAMAVDPGARPSAAEVVEILEGRREAPGLPPELEVAPTRVTSRRAVAPRPPGYRRAWGVAAAVTLLVGAGGLGWWTAPPGAPPGATTAEVRAFPEELLATWEARGDELDAPGRIAALHRQIMVDPNAADYLKEMSKVRLPDKSTDRVRPEAIGPLAEALPWREELEAARAHLLEVAGDAAYPFRRRAALARALRPFAYLDAYFGALGHPMPYEVRGIRRAVHPWKLVPGEKPRPRFDAVEVVDPREPLGPGRHLLHQWTVSHDRDFPWLVAQGGEPHAMEMQWLLMAKMASNNAWSMHDHAFLRGRFTLGPEPGRRFPQVDVRVEVGNFYPPQVLEVELDEHLVQLFRDPEGVETGHWRPHSQEDTVLVLTLPGELLREGPNAVRIGVRPLPGLLRYQGMEADRIWVELEEDS